MKSHQEFLFPKLNQDCFKIHSVKMVKHLWKYPITKIRLYHYDREPRHDKTGELISNLPIYNEVAEYALVFVFAKVDEKAKEKFSVKLNLINLKLREKRESSKDLISIGAGKELRRCYELDPGPHYAREWNFFSMVKGGEEPIGVKGTGLDIYSKAPSDHDAFLNSLRVEVVNDSEIKIRELEKEYFHYHCKHMGFRDKMTKTWQLLIDTLRQDPPIIYLYDQPVSDKYLDEGYDHERGTVKRLNKKHDKDYDNKRKTLSRLNEKLADFFRNEFQIDLPKGYKLYDRYQPGKYFFKFKRPGFHKTERFDTMRKDTLLKEINSLAFQYLKNKDDSSIRSDLFIACQVAQSKGWITQEEMKDNLKIDQ